MAQTSDVRNDPDGTARARLEAERDRLRLGRQDVGEQLEDVQQGETAELSGTDQHPADTGTETSDQEYDQAIVEQLSAQLGEVDDALARIDRGEYGLCELCGQPIDPDRLEALPAARYCRQDQERAEQEQGRPPLPSSPAGSRSSGTT